MCEYCKKEKKIEEQENDNIHLSIYGRHLRILGKVPMMHINFGRDVIINYCPMCRKEIKRGRKIMEQWLRDAIAEEQGYVICPLSGETYTICDEKCERCESYIDFIEALKEREEDKR